MAAAVVPSRARAARNAPPSSDVTYVRMNLIIDHLEGDLQPEPKHYFFRWIRSGKQVKVTAAKPASASPFAERMALYASVRRHGPVFVSDDPSESLDTQLVLVMTEPNGEPTVVSTVAFDIAYYLNAIVEAGTKTLAETIQMPSSITLRVTLAVKAMGDDHLHRYVPERQLGLPNSASADMDEAAAALELERLRQEVREKEHRLGALEQSTDSLQDAVRRAQPAVDPTVLAAAQGRVKELEDKLALTDREKSEAQRRVQAHMAHAVKIRETYERLAVWYNDLRQEHSELRKKYDEQSRTSSELGDRSIGSESSANEIDLRTLREERDKLQTELQQEQSENSEMHSRNSQLLETKARALAELRDQWDSAQTTLAATQQENEEKTRALEELRKTVDSLRSELLERSATLEEKSSELEENLKQMQSMQFSHSEALEIAKRETSEEVGSLAASETEKLLKKHQEEVQELREKMKAEMDVSVQTEHEKLDAEKAKEIEALREQIRQEYESKRSTEMARLVTEHEKRVKEEEGAFRQRLVDLETTARASNEAASSSQNEKVALESQLLALRNDYESQLAEKDLVTRELREAHAKEMETAAHQKDELNRELLSLRSGSSVEIEKREEEHRQKSAALQEECTRLGGELASLRKENEEIRTSPRTISAATGDNETEEIAERLNGQIAELKILLKAETEKRSETAKLLSNADREHEELRDMVTRLRSERDKALQDVKRAKEAIPNPEIRHAAVRRSMSDERRTEDAIDAEEERDKAIRELFRVRKNLNKEIRKLKKENRELTEQSSGAAAADSERSSAVDQLTEERDKVRADLQHVQSELEAASRSLITEQEASRTKGLQTNDLRNRLKTAEGDMTALRATVGELQESLAASRKESADRVAQLTEEREELVRELNSSKSSKKNTEAALRDNEERVASLTSQLTSATKRVADTSQENEETSRERDSARNKSAALATELETLKQSLSSMSSSSSSTETMLRDAQKEVAESKAEAKLLRSELDDLRNEVEMKAARREEEASNFETTISQQRSLLASERTARDELGSRIAEFEGLVARLNSKNETLSAKLNSELGMREDAEKRVADAEKRIERLREELSQVRTNELAGAEAVGRANAEREQTNRSLSDATQRLQSLEQSLTQKNAEFMEVQKKLGVAEAAADTLRSESSKSSEDGKAVREELQAVRTELAQVQDELRQKSQQLEHEISKGSELAEQETAAVRDLTGLSENLRAENANLQSRLEATQDELRGLKESYFRVESKLEIAERDVVARDRSLSDYEGLKQAHLQLKEDMSRASEESSRFRKDKSDLESQVQSLEKQITSLREQIYTTQDENEKLLTTERASGEREAAKSNELRKELRSARALVESLQAEIEQIKGDNEKLSKEKGDAGDSHVLKELINTRLELAYAQEEAVRLRNKLKKVAPKGSGSASFEY